MMETPEKQKAGREMASMRMRRLYLFMVFSALLLEYGCMAPAPDTEPLFDFQASHGAGALDISDPRQVHADLAEDGVTVAIDPGRAAYPGIILRKDGGIPWDLSSYGHVEATVANLGSSSVRVSMRVDTETSFRQGTGNRSGELIQPGKSATIKVIFGYDGKAPGARLDTKSISHILFYTGKAAEARRFRIESVRAGGRAGETPLAERRLVPPDGVILGDGVGIQLERQVSVQGGAKASLGQDGKSFRIDFCGGKNEWATFKPDDGVWNLSDYFSVKVRVSNIGQTPASPCVRLESVRGSAQSSASAPLQPQEETEIVIPFEASVSWRGVQDKSQESAEGKRQWGTPQPGTGTGFTSHRVAGVRVSTVEKDVSKSLLVKSIVAFNPPLSLPDWLGRRPPAEGDWVKTLDESFEGGSLDYKRWNIYNENPWDRQAHFTKDNVILKDGMLHLRMTRQRGRHNDDPKREESDYATGFADTFGKWTQRYGYYEARVKLPKAPCLWTAFWLMPDRSKDCDKALRRSTKDGGMEFDIMEGLSIWGAQRYNVSTHWDGYQGSHKSLGTECNYVQADKDGFIVCGMLWTPGVVVFYGNGKEIFRWESPRVGGVQSYIILDHVTNGWEKEPLDDSQLPADFVIDYVRVWQRKDLASPEDGPKPNKGLPDVYTE